MAKKDIDEEIKALKKALSQAKRESKALEKEYNEAKLENDILKCKDPKKARELLLSSLSEKERQLMKLLFPDQDTAK